MSVLRSFAPGLYAGGQPSLTDLAMHAAAGVRTVMNLRAPDELIGFDEEREVARLGMRYVAFPIAGPQDVTSKAAARFSRELDRAKREGHPGQARTRGADHPGEFAPAGCSGRQRQCSPARRRRDRAAGTWAFHFRGRPVRSTLSPMLRECASGIRL